MLSSLRRAGGGHAPIVALAAVAFGLGCGDVFHSTDWQSRCEPESLDDCEARGGAGVANGSGASGHVGAGASGATGADGPAGSVGSGSSGAGAGATTSGVGAGCVASAEVCNAVDDDCDGQIDEELGDTTCGIGPCQVTQQNCMGGKPHACTPAPPQPEACNFADDDCDGDCDEAAGCRNGVHRSYSNSTGEHFYSIDINEAQCCGFTLEFANFFYVYGVQLPGLAPLYRCALFAGKHLLTQDAGCEGAGSLEGPLGYVGSAPAPCGGNLPLYRLVLPGPNDHFYTTSLSEHDTAIGLGYLDEGITGYVWQSP